GAGKAGELGDRVARAPARATHCAAGAPASAPRHRGQLVGQLHPRITRTIARETRAAADRRSRFLAALRCHEKRGAGAHEGADEQAGAKEADVLPIDGTAVRRAAWPLDGRNVVIIRRGSAANVGARGGALVRFSTRGVWAR